MSMKALRDRYKVPAKRGTRIRYDDGVYVRHGVIAGSCKECLRVKFDGYSVTCLLALPHHLSFIVFDPGAGALHKQPKQLELF